MNQTRVDPAAALFLDRHRALSDSVAQITGRLTPEQLTQRPGQGLNSAAWVIWHMIRTEDYGSNRVLADRPQVLDDGWMKRLNLARRTPGTGMSDDEVTDFGSRVDVTVLLDYARTVFARTQEVVGAMSGDLNRRPDEARLLKAMTAEDNFPPEVGRRLFEQRKDKPLWWWMGQRLGHSHQHLGELTTIASLLGVRGA